MFNLINDEKICHILVNERYNKISANCTQQQAHLGHLKRMF